MSEVDRNNDNLISHAEFNAAMMEVIAHRSSNLFGGSSQARWIFERLGKYYKISAREKEGYKSQVRTLLQRIFISILLTFILLTKYTN